MCKDLNRAVDDLTDYVQTFLATLGEVGPVLNAGGTIKFRFMVNAEDLETNDALFDRVQQIGIRIIQLTRFERQVDAAYFLDYSLLGRNLLIEVIVMDYTMVDMTEAAAHFCCAQLGVPEQPKFRDLIYRLSDFMKALIRNDETTWEKTIEA